MVRKRKFQLLAEPLLSSAGPPLLPPPGLYLVCHQETLVSRAH